MTMLIHEVVTFSCYLVSNVKYIKKKSKKITYCLLSGSPPGWVKTLFFWTVTDFFFFFFLLILNSKVS